MPRYRFGLHAVMVALLVSSACGGDDRDGEGGDDTVATTDGQEQTAPSVDAPATDQTADSDPATASDPPAATDPGEATEPPAVDVVTVSAGQERRLAEDAVVRCDGGGDVYVLDGARAVTVSGDCGDIEVRASGATIVAGRSNDLDIYGSGNGIVAGDVSDLGVYGDDNTIAVVSVVEIDVEGDRNAISFGSGSPQIDDEGTGNVIVAG